MNKKAVTIVCVILALFALVSFGYIFINSNQEVEQKSNTPSDGDAVIENPIDEEPREERGQNVILTSRIGLLLTEAIRYSNVYSNYIQDELDSNGLSNNAKLLISLDKINRKADYSGYIGYSEEYASTYVLADNMKKVIEDTFVDTQISYSGIENVMSYDEATSSFIIFPSGFEAGSISYCVEVPYKITQYSDRIELLAYKLYVTQTIKMEGITTIVENKIYYDKAKSVLAISTTDQSFTNEQNQVDYLREKIESEEIEISSVEKVKYTFNQTEDKYKMLSYEEI